MAGPMRLWLLNQRPDTQNLWTAIWQVWPGVTCEATRHAGAHQEAVGGVPLLLPQFRPLHTLVSGSNNGQSEPAQGLGGPCLHSQHVLMSHWPKCVTT